jgi:hypothetical protein
MNTLRIESNQEDKPPKIKVIKKPAKKKAKKKFTLLEISLLINKANKKGPDSLTPDELEIVNEFSWIEEIDGDAYHLLQEMLFHLEEGPAEGVTPKDVVEKVSQKDAQEYRDARITLMKLVDNLQLIHDFGWKGKKPDRNIKDGYYMSRSVIARTGLMEDSRILQAEAKALKRLRKLPKKKLEEYRQEMFEAERPDQDGSPTNTKMRKDDY